MGGVWWVVGGGPGIYVWVLCGGWWVVDLVYMYGYCVVGGGPGMYGCCVVGGGWWTWYICMGTVWWVVGGGARVGGLE
jgi:hypothetical protein